jgi:hypothetical protein
MGVVDEMAASIILRTYLAQRMLDDKDRNADECSER